MENIIWALSLWALVFVLIPLERLKQLWPVAVIAYIWMYIMNFTFVYLGYYKFTKQIVELFGVSLLIPLGGAAGGILLMNWFPRNPLYKISVVLLFSGFMGIASYIYQELHAFQMSLGFNHLLHFFVNVAGVSVLAWLSLGILGEDTIYEGNKTRFLKDGRLLRG